DDQIRRPYGSDLLDLRRLQRPLLGMIAVAIGLGPQQPVAWTFAVCLAEECSHLPPPGHHGELVHGGDQHRGRMTVDFVVHHQDRKSQILRLRLAELAPAILVATVDEGSTEIPVDPYFPT